MEEEANALFVSYYKKSHEAKEIIDNERIPVVVYSPVIYRTCIKAIKHERETFQKRLLINFIAEQRMTTYVIIIYYMGLDKEKSYHIKNFKFIRIHNDIGAAEKDLEQIINGDHKLYLENDERFLEAVCVITMIQDS